jgi:hypothetical protein
MTSKAIMFLLGITEAYGIDVIQMVVALWFFSVSYRLYKRANRTMVQQRVTARFRVAEGELPYLTAESYRVTGM